MGLIGKGLAQEVKYFEVTGINGNAVRIDLNKGKECPTEYLYDSIFLLANPHSAPAAARNVTDPYDNTRSLSILPHPTARLDRERYKRLIVDLIEGTDHVISNVLLLDEAYEIVKILDRIWGAIQGAKCRWRRPTLGTLQPVQPGQDR